MSDRWYPVYPGFATPETRAFVAKLEEALRPYHRNSGRWKPEVQIRSHPGKRTKDLVYVVLKGLKSGGHEIWADSIARAVAHTRGYLENNGKLKPKVGAQVIVSTGPGRTYFAKVLKVGKTRATVQWRFDAGHQSAPRSFPFDQISW